MSYICEKHGKLMISQACPNCLDELRAEVERLRHLLEVLPEFDWETHIGEAGGVPWNPHVDWDDYMVEVRAALEGDE